MNNDTALEITRKPVGRLTYTMREACEALGVGPTTLYRLEKRKLLRSVQGLRHKRYSIEEIKRFIAGSVSVA